jgi:hypothetical protein
MPNDVQNVAAESSPAAIASPEPIDLSTLSREERMDWRETGKLPGDSSAVAAEKKTPSPEDSATSPNKSAVDQTGNTAPASEAGKKPQEQARDNADTRKVQLNAEIRDLLAKRDALKQELVAPKKDVATKPSPVAKKAEGLEAPAKPVRPDQNDPKFKTWEDYEKAERQYQLDHDEYVEKVADYKAKKAVEEDRAVRAQEEQQKTLAAEMVEVKKRYPDFEEKAVPALKKFFDDPEVPDFIKGTVGSSEVKHDLIYALGDSETWAKIVDVSKTDPRKALKAIFAVEDAIAAELSGKKSETTTADKTTGRDESGKFTSQKEAPDKPVTRVVGKPSEVGGRGTDTEDEGVSAARAGDFRTTKAVWDRQFAERNK